MSDPIPHSDDPKIQAKIDKAVRHNSLVDYALRWLLHYIERLIAVMTILALLGALGMEIYHMIASGAAYFADVETMLHHILNIVVGLEFVRMLIDTTPANILEVLTVAITRHVVLSHDDPWSNVACIACIAGLFAIRRFLVRRSELRQEMVDSE